VTPGGPTLDLLNGAAAGATGGQYRHEIEAQAGYTDNGYGARLSADWRSGTTVIGGGAASSGTLDFSPVSTINLRVWDDFTPQTALVTRYPFLRGLRVTFSVTNLFNQSISVKDSGGPTPLIYQSNYLDPTGRVISINLRKLFD
jgi:iron complex outermembrane receptor protein